MARGEQSARLTRRQGDHEEAEARRTTSAREHRLVAGGRAGANDGIVSTTSLVLGVVGANVSHGNIILTGIAGLVAGAMSMATGEYVLVSSQADTEKAALPKEELELEEYFPSEDRELAAIYVRRGLDATIARPLQVALASASCGSCSGARSRCRD